MKLSVVFLIYCVVAVKGEGKRIAGGSNVNINQYPFATALLTNGGAGEYVQACGGTILTTSAILSAASCFYTDGAADPVSWWRARVGSEFASTGGTVHLISRITPHPNFLISTLDNDLGIIRTSVPINMQPGLTEAARIAGAVFTLASNQPVWAIGWGATSTTVASSEQLRHVQFWVVNQETCQNRYNELNFTVTSNMVCTGWLDVGVRGQCLGDTGSPLLESGVVAGVFSWSESCAQSRYPGLNTRISLYTRWIVATATEA